MNKKSIVATIFLTIAVLFSILFQSIHSYEHLGELFSEEDCHHTYTSKHEITHQHQDSDECFVCHFTISSFITSDCFEFEYVKMASPSGYTFFTSRKFTQFFKGSLFALRAPPFSLR